MSASRSSPSVPMDKCHVPKLFIPGDEKKEEDYAIWQIVWTSGIAPFGDHLTNCLKLGISVERCREFLLGSALNDLAKRVK